MKTVICKLGKAARKAGKVVIVKPIAWYLTKSAENYERLLGPEWYKYARWI